MLASQTAILGYMINLLYKDTLEHQVSWDIAFASPGVYVSLVDIRVSRTDDSDSPQNLGHGLRWHLAS